MQRRTPLGYYIQNGKAEIEPETAEFVREIFSTYLAGISTYRIAKDFTRRGILNASHKPSWNHGSIGKILENRKYIGDEFYPPLIEQSIFEQVQSRRIQRVKDLGRAAQPNSFANQSVWSSLLVCGECGQPYRKYTEKGKPPKWRCKHYIYRNRVHCRNRFLSEEQLEQAFVRVINQVIGNPAYLNPDFKELPLTESIAERKLTELYTNMRYLQYNTLQRLGLGHFDSWAASFGETQTAIELAPEGTGYRAKTRFAKFFNLPELIALFKESADIQTPDMLKLPVPEADYENIVLKPSEYQQDMVQSLADRAEAVRDRKVDPSRDNMLKITNDGRKLALDQRLINDMLPDEENSKATTCVDKAFEIWEHTKEQKSAQLIFCDLSTPKGDGTFNVYEDIRDKLMAKGVPENEIAFIHDANTETRKAELFAKVRSGQVRFLLGSTAKMGAGTNVQDRLIALHHLDVPWRPSEEDRAERYINKPSKIKAFRSSVTARSARHYRNLQGKLNMEHKYTESLQIKSQAKF